MFSFLMWLVSIGTRAMGGISSSDLADWQSNYGTSGW